MSRYDISALVVAITVSQCYILLVLQYISTTLVLIRHSQYKQKDKDMVVLGVHSPEFTFEKNYANVKGAVQRFGITYPVILDSDHGTWNAYGNQYWPRYYLIDTQGYIRYDHIGEGGYDQIEKAIQSLVAERVL